MGRRGGGDYAGVVYPYFAPKTHDVVLHRLRLDSPPVDANGKVEHKYLTAPGARNHLYIPPSDPALLGDAATPVVFTEGEKKALALSRMALETGNGSGKPTFLPISIPGVWSFRSTTGIRANSKGERVAEKGVIPDLGHIAWTGRKVTILYDANAATNTSVAAARRELARELSRRGADVWISELPPLTGVNGADDLLGLFGVEKALEVLKSAIRYQWRDDLIRSDKGKTLPLLANALTALRGAPEWHGALAFNEHALVSPHSGKRHGELSRHGRTTITTC